MSKSIEALENLVHCKSETKCKECKHKYRCTMERDYHTIKQELERLEEINKVWLQNEPMESVDFKAYQLQILYDYINVKEKENQELKELQELNKQGLWNLKQENQKLKNAIEILKDKLKLSLNDNKANKTINAVLPIGNNDMNKLTQQEYELLKEVLEDER